MSLLRLFFAQTPVIAVRFDIQCHAGSVIKGIIEALL